jgi:predicted metalloprotease with PDZ domain
MILKRLITVFAALCALASASTLQFQVSLAHRAAHSYHVTLRCTGLAGGTQDFTMPEWMPGYYGIMHYARQVSNFTARNGAGRALEFEHTTESTWRVVTGAAPVVEVSYDVSATRAFAASNSLDENRGFIAPPGLFVYVEGQLRHPATVAITDAPATWTTIATGLDGVAGSTHTFTAPDFDTLYDSPWLLGSQPVVDFSVGGVPHQIVLQDIPPSVDTKQMAGDLARIVTTATGMMGGIPYHRYVFLMMGHGNGGIEHLNSAAIAFNGNSLLTPAGYHSWLSYVAHEYFHNFNVKRIRPLALGPFDYQTENYTHMLWVSEGLTVYYEDLLVERAGLMTQAEYIERLRTQLEKFENTTGHRYQSATESSLDAWGTGSGEGADRATSVSYYDNGALLGAMLDLAIRQASGERASLDTAMRTLYQTYYLRDHRGFTDAEFREACEKAAGVSLGDIFAYAATSKEPDYQKYFAYAGLQLSATPTEAPGTYLGMNTDPDLPADYLPVAVAPAGGGGRGGRAPATPPLRVASVDPGSPAARAGINAGDVIIQLDGAAVTPAALNARLAAAHAGDKLEFQVERGGTPRPVEVTVEANHGEHYTLAVNRDSSPLQARILRSWLQPPVR